MGTILIKNGCVWDGERFGKNDILINGQTIERIEPSIAETADTVYHADGKTVSAGLVDMHVHMRGISCDKYGIGADLSCIPFGVTAAADAGCEHGDPALLHSLTVKTAVFVPVRFRKNQADFSKTEEILRRMSGKAIGIKCYFDVTQSEVSDVTPLRQVCDFAHKQGLCVMVHSSHAPVSMSELLAVLDAGDILTHAFHGEENNAAEDGFASLWEAQRRGVVIDVGFAGHVHTDFGILRQAIEADMIPDVISTDVTRLSSYVRGGRYGITMCMSIAAALGMSEEALFRAVTSNPAKALGKADEWGYLKVGRRADLAVLSYTDEGFDLTDRAGNRIKSKKGYRCVLTVADGQIVYRN